MQAAAFMSLATMGHHSFASALAAFGYCARCQERHEIPTTPLAEHHARILQETLASTGRLDFDTAMEGDDGNPLLEVSRLYETRGKMIGVLVATNSSSSTNHNDDDDDAKIVVLKAFAGKIRSYGWQLHGWVDPIVVPEAIPRFVELRDEVSRVTVDMEQAKEEDEELLFRQLQNYRSQLSQEALEVMRQEQRVGNFRDHNESELLSHIFQETKRATRTIGMPPMTKTTFGKQKKPKQMPVGVGECCATKLVHAARMANLKPLGIAEFFLGRSGKRRVDHGVFYDACADRCQQVLGFMLCGLDDENDGSNH